MGCGFTFIDYGFVTVPALAIFLIEILSCCVVFYTCIDPFAVFQLLTWTSKGKFHRHYREDFLFISKIAKLDGNMS